MLVKRDNLTHSECLKWSYKCDSIRLLLVVADGVTPGSSLREVQFKKLFTYCEVNEEHDSENCASLIVLV